MIKLVIALLLSNNSSEEITNFSTILCKKDISFCSNFSSLHNAISVISSKYNFSTSKVIGANEIVSIVVVSIFSNLV